MQMVEQKKENTDNYNRDDNSSIKERESKYKGLKQHLGQFELSTSLTSSQFPPPQLQPTAGYYFGQLGSLHSDILLEQNQISQLRLKIQFMKTRYSSMAVKYAQKKKKQQQRRLIHCQHSECRESFEKERELYYHRLFVHNSDELMSGNVFTFEVNVTGNSMGLNNSNYNNLSSVVNNDQSKQFNNY